MADPQFLNLTGAAYPQRVQPSPDGLIYLRTAGGMGNPLDMRPAPTAPVVGQYGPQTDQALGQAADLGMNVAMPLGLAALGGPAVLNWKNLAGAALQSIFGPMTHPDPNVLQGAMSKSPEEPSIWYHGTKALFDELDPAFSHPGSEHGKAAYITDRPSEAANYGNPRQVEFSGQIFPEHAPLDRTLMNQVAQRLAKMNPDRIPQLQEAIQTIRRDAERFQGYTNDVAMQELSHAFPGELADKQGALNNALKDLGYSAREYREDSGARTLAVFDKSAIRLKPKP